jgi:hypothetical protein
METLELFLIVNYVWNSPMQEKIFSILKIPKKLSVKKKTLVMLTKSDTAEDIKIIMVPEPIIVLNVIEDITQIGS